MTTMRVLTEDDLVGAAGEAFRRVFRTVAYDDVTESQSIMVEPHREPFRAGMECRLILWEVLSYSLVDEIDALAEAARSVGDDSFYCLVTEGGGFGFDDKDIAPGYEVPFDDLASYKANARFFLETALFSTAGTWGWITSNEQQAVVGGSARFIDVLTASLPASPTGAAAADQVHDFLDHVKAAEWPTPERWLPKHLAHVYGDAVAKKLLAQHGF